MDANKKRQLIIKHAQLTAAHAAGNESALAQLQQIEDTLQMSSAQIATLAATAYLRDY